MPVAKVSKPWSLLSSHGLVLAAISQIPDDTVLGIVERTHLSRATVLRAIRDLETARMVTTHRQGRRNIYSVDPTVTFRHPLLHGARIEGLIEAVAPGRKRTNNRAGGNRPASRPRVAKSR
jgi:DNA-binding transcriptional ArsR family regulator